MNAVRTDYHIHTTLCHHAVGDPIEYVQAAQRAGLTEIGFADHNPMPEQFDAWRMSMEDLPQYFEMVEGARSTGFPVRLGLECDFVDGYEAWIEKLAGMAQWDYLIGSVHYIAPGWDVDNPKYLARFTQYPVEEITVAGNLKELFFNISEIANDLEFRGSVAAPTIRVDGLTVGGE